jgi:hypothetical protein
MEAILGAAMRREEAIAMECELMKDEKMDFVMEWS